MSRRDDRKLCLLWDVLLLFTRGRRYPYRIEEVQAQSGRRWRLERHEPRPGDVTHYHVTATPKGMTCDCPAGKRGRSCKHSDSVAKLLSEGRL